MILSQLLMQLWILSVRMKISKKQKKAVTGAIDDIFYKLKARLLGRFFKGPAIFFEAVKRSDPMTSLEGIYRYTLQLTHGPGFEPDEDNLKDLAEITDNYIEAERLKTQNQIFNDISAADVPSEIKESVKKRLDKATNYLDTLLVTETRIVQAYAEKEGITQVGASMGIEDPTVAKLGIIDDKLCENCKKLWHSEKNIKIPKVYKLSELQEGYNKDWKNPVPTLGPTHPNCRHVLTMISPNFGFDANGNIDFIGLGHDEYKKQRGED